MSAMRALGVCQVPIVSPLPGCARSCDKCVTKVLKSGVLRKGLLRLQKLKQKISKKYDGIEG